MHPPLQLSEKFRHLQQSEGFLSVFSPTIFLICLLTVTISNLSNQFAFFIQKKLTGCMYIHQAQYFVCDRQLQKLSSRTKFAANQAAPLLHCNAFASFSLPPIY